MELRESSYFFGVPSGYLGPFTSEKLDLIATGRSDVLFLHAVNTNRIEPFGGAHGEFVRIEDDRRLGAGTVRFAAGVGGGVLGQRSVTLAFAQPVTRDRRVSLSAAVDLTTLSPTNYQRVVGIGPEFAVGRVNVVARYYRATATAAPSTPPAASVLAAAPVSRDLGLLLAANFGGELNADRTSGFLPTSSGRYGTDLSLAVRLRLGARTNLLGAYEGAAYRAAPSGDVARRQHIVTVGVAFGPSH